MQNKKKFKIEDVPYEVQKVWVIQRYCEDMRTGIGSVLWNECQDIINKYPEWFSSTASKETHLEDNYDDENPDYIKGSIEN